MTSPVNKPNFLSQAKDLLKDINNLQPNTPKYIVDGIQKKVDSLAKDGLSETFKPLRENLNNLKQVKTLTGQEYKLDDLTKLRKAASQVLSEKEVKVATVDAIDNVIPLLVEISKLTSLSSVEEIKSALDKAKAAMDDIKFKGVTRDISQIIGNLQVIFNVKSNPQQESKEHSEQLKSWLEKFSKINEALTAHVETLVKDEFYLTQASCKAAINMLELDKLSEDTDINEIDEKINQIDVWLTGYVSNIDPIKDLLKMYKKKLEEFKKLPSKLPEALIKQCLDNIKDIIQRG